jgi:hypothetical protein
MAYSVNLQTLKAVLEEISPTDRKKYKLGRRIEVKSPVIGGKRADVILPNDVNIDSTIENIKTLLDAKYNTSGKKQVNIIHLTSGTKKEIYIGNYVLNVKKETRTDYNLGNVAEGVFAAAIACRFTNKNSTVTSDDVYSMLDKLKANGKHSISPALKSYYSEVTLKSPNLNIAIQDDVHLRVELSSANMDFLFGSKSNSKDLSGYVNGAVKYANNQKVVKWAKLVYENNRKDKIEVLSKGVRKQETSKVDVEVQITDDRGKLMDVDIKVSLKVSDVKQFGQKGGVEFDGLKEFVDTIFNIDIQTLQRKYDQLVMVDKKIVDAFNLIYDHIDTQLNQTLRSNEQTKKKLFENIGKGIQHYATLHEDYVEMVNIGNNDARIYNFKDLPEQLKQYDFVATKSTYPTGDGNERLPILTIEERIGGKKLITVRAKKEVKSTGKVYFRNYLEKEEFLSDIVSRSA